MNLQPAIDLIKQFEGFRAQAYQDMGGVWTIGYGETQAVTPDETCTQEQADTWLLARVTALAEMIQERWPALNPNQICALISFAYNLGYNTLSNSTLARDLTNGNYDLAAAEFLLWDHVGKREIDGLYRRRTAERALFLTEDL
jgi:lysozyme